jgi:hypothetical protein
VNLGVSIAASATGNVWMAAAINLADDAIFTVADVSSGYLELEEGMLSFGKRALNSAMSAGTGLSFDALEGALGAFAEEGVCKALLQGVESAANRLTSATVNALELDPDGQLMFDISRYKETLAGRLALRSYLAEVSGSTAAHLAEGNLTGFSSEHAGDVLAVSRLAGGLTQASLEYALTGQTILNLADFSMFGLQANGRALSGGMLELHLASEHPRIALGQLGADVSLGAFADAASGMDSWIESMRIRRYDRSGSWVTAEEYQGYGSVETAMRSLYSYGDAEGQTLYEELLSGKTKLLIGYTDSGAQTQLLGGGKRVHLSTLGDARDRNSRLMSGVVLQHEALRDGITSEALNQQLETRRAVAARAVMLMAIEQDYGGIIGSDIKSLIDVLMHQAGEDTFNRYVDELWSSEGDFAERITNRRTIGVRRTQLFDLQKYTPGLAAAFRWAAAGLGGNANTDYLLPESDVDPQHQVLKDLTDSDAVATQWSVLGALLGTASWAIHGGNLGKSILGLDPLDAPDLLGATSALLNDATIARAVFDALGDKRFRKRSSDDVTDAFSQMMKGIFEAESLPEMEWYTRATAIYADSKIFDVAAKAGIPLQVDNRWLGNERLEAQVANQMMRNYMFVGEMVFSGIADPEIVGKMYYQGFANPVSMGNGLTLWENVSGFAARNRGPWDDWETNTTGAYLQYRIKEINAYNMTYFALVTNNMELYQSLPPRTINVYDDWAANNRYYEANRDMWADYDHYYSSVYQNLMRK